MQATCPDELLTADAVAKRLGLTPGTIKQWYRDGRIPGLRLSHKVLRFRWAAVLSALEAKQPTEARS